MIAHKTDNRARASLMAGTSRLAIPTGHHRLRRCPGGARRRRESLLSRPRVWAARQRLATGRYDSDELLDAVLDRVIEDLRS